jgi:hypothetical protein
MKRNIILIIAAITAVACRNNQQEPIKSISEKNDSSSAASAFFPVTEFIGGELKMVDSLKPPITKEITIDNKKTLSGATDQEFKSYAQAFLHPDINDPAIKSFYKESSIADQSIPSVTFLFSTTKEDLPLKTINVYVKPDPVLNDKVSSVYMEKQWTANDTAYSQKLYWKTGHNFQIITEKTIQKKVLPKELVKFTWDPTE